MNMHRRCVLPALLLAVVHVVERRPLSVQLVILDRRRDGGDDGERLGMTKRQPQRPLSAHADAEQSERTRLEAPALTAEREEMIENEALRRERCVELGADALAPPRMLSGRTE